VTVDVGAQRYAISADWSFAGIRGTGSCNGRSFTAQVERHGLWYRAEHNGLRIEAHGDERPRQRTAARDAVQGAGRHEQVPAVADAGLLVDVAVKPGQAVQAGERLAVIEAMKMENILTATQDGVVKDVLAAKGESLAVDQPIIAFA
jgi:propionyl-CoA carboxylase alpha chain